MKEEFVTYEIAQKLKKKGYPIKRKRSGILGLTRQEYIDELPTISQVLKWLREEKCLHIEIQYIFSEETIWEFEVVLIGSYERWWNGSESLDSYEQAAIAGIEYALDNLI